MKKFEIKKKQNTGTKPKRLLLNKLINECESPIEVSPAHVLVVSLLFITSVFLLHLLSKFSYTSSTTQLILAVLVIIGSVVAGNFINKKRN